MRGREGDDEVPSIEPPLTAGLWGWGRKQEEESGVRA